MSRRPIPSPFAAAPGPFALMAITGSGVSPRLLAALAARRPAAPFARRVMHPVAPDADTRP